MILLRKRKRKKSVLSISFLNVYTKSPETSGSENLSPKSVFSPTLNWEINHSVCDNIYKMFFDVHNTDSPAVAVDYSFRTLKSAT